MIPIAEAISIIKREISLLESETVDLSAVCGRVLAEDILADTDLPPFNRSQMDGFAVKSEDLEEVPRKLKIVGESIAGRRWEGELKNGETVRIMTGAALPKGADAVQKVELTKEIEGFVEILETTFKGQFFVKKATEIKKGEKVFSKGQRVSEKMIAVLASFGYAKIKVAKRPKVSILATGSELVEVEKTPKQDEIRDSNSQTLKTFIEPLAEIETVALVSDDLEKLKDSIAEINSDIIILTGGVSMGDYDFTKPALLKLGADILFEKVQLKPGKPCVFAKLGKQIVFGLPGNPVSVIVTFFLFVRTAILRMQNATSSELKTGLAILTRDMKAPLERDAYLPAVIEINENAQLTATPLRFSGSSDFVGFAQAEVLVHLPQGKRFQAGDIVNITFI